jgi:HSP20 family molecular chaperone IbpA
MSLNVRSYPKVYEIDANNFDNELDVVLDKLLGPKVEKNECQPSVRGRQTASTYYLEINFPGISEKGMEINFEGGNLTIQSVGSESFLTGSGKNTRLKRVKNIHFRKIYRLPEDANPQGFSASFSNGTLSLAISKKVKIV